MYVAKRSHHNPILTPDRDNYWEAFATFNMSVIKKGKTFYGAYRAIGAEDKLLTPHQISIIGLGKSKDGRHFEDRIPFITPEEEWEKYGCEDPRITFFEGQYYTFYTALSKYPFEANGIKVALAISKDLKKVHERHLITPFNAKAMTLFPERISNKITVIVTVNTDMPPSKIALAQVDRMEELWNQEFWKKWYENIDEHVIDLKKSPSDHVEVGAQPIKTNHGWLLLYSHIQNYFSGGDGSDRIFGIEAILLDFHDPFKIIGRTRGPILVPREPYELVGHVSNIVFPSGAVLEKDRLLIYYGAADTTVCLAHVNITDLLSTMRTETADRWHFHRSLKNPIIVPNKANPWEAQATFNPAALKIKNIVYLLYRALSFDNTSSIGYAKSKDGINFSERQNFPVYIPRENFELKKVTGGNSGCEDPRLTKIGKTIYMCYTAFDGIGPPRVAVTSITEKNFLLKNWQWEPPILITPAGFDDKDTCIFPEKTNGKYFILHRVGDEICGDFLKSLNFKNQIIKKCIRLIGPRINTWDSLRVGICAPPIKTKHGWLLLYHGISKNHHTYRIGAVLLDLNDPTIVISRTSDPIFEPEEQYEKVGIINNVVFPCGMVEKNDLLYIYYGGADVVVGVATIEMDIVLRALTRDVKNKKK
jgi:predicted GH43/DUF377 family glycosyl hydrolase